MPMRFSVERVIRSSRFNTRGWIAGSAVVCAFVSLSAIAQSTSEFIDPLEEQRIKVQTQQEAADRGETRQTPAPRAPAVERRVEQNSPEAALRRLEGNANSGPTFLDKVRKALRDIAAQFGLTTGALAGLLTLALAGLAALIGWTLFRGKRRRVRDTAEQDIYNDGIGSNRRRMLGEGLPAAKTDVYDDVDDNEIFEETMPQGFDDIYVEEARQTPAFGKRSKQAETPKSNNPKEWKKPSLDRLKASIKADWAANKAEKKAAAEDDWDVGDDNTPETSFFNPGKAPVGKTSDPADMPLTEVVDGWDDWDRNAKPDDDVWGAPAESAAPEKTDEPRDDALKRIRALRDSLRAS